jgi:hypothetical protein
LCEERPAWGGWGWLGVAEGGWKSRKREQKERRVREHRREIFGKWFTENFSVNRFPFFPSPFYGQLQTFSV